MEVLVKNLESIGSGILALLDLLWSTVKGMADVVAILTNFLMHIPHYFLWLPDSIVAIIMAIFGCAIAYKILGRDG